MTATEHDNDDALLLRYSRHILLDEIGIEGQQKLSAAHILVVGCGGLAAALPYLAASGVGTLTIADSDTVELHNLQRQVAFDEGDVGKPKAETLAGRLKRINHTVDVRAVNEKLDGCRLTGLVQTADIVLDCCDNYATRQAVNRACVQTKTPLVSGRRYVLKDSLPHTVPTCPTRRVTPACSTADRLQTASVPLRRALAAGRHRRLHTGGGGSENPAGSGRTVARQAGGLPCLGRGWQYFDLPRNPECPVCGAAR